MKPTTDLMRVTIPTVMPRSHVRGAGATAGSVTAGRGTDSRAGPRPTGAGVHFCDGRAYGTVQLRNGSARLLVEQRAGVCPAPARALALL